MSRALATLLLLSTVSASAAPLVDGPHPIVVVYGDSRWWKASPTNTDYDLWLPADFKVRNFAKPGAEAWSQPVCSTNAPDTSPLTAALYCSNGEDRAVRSGGACLYQPSDWRVPTCVEDQEADAAAYGPVYWWEFGANDVRTNAESDTAGWAASLARYSDALSAFVAAVPANAPCVLSLTFPIYEDTSSPLLSDDEANRRIDQDLRGLLTAAAAMEGCAFADLYQATLDYEAAAGTAAMLALYFDCPAKGSPSTEDCVHLDSSLAIEVHPLVAEILRARRDALARKPNRWQ